MECNSFGSKSQKEIFAEASEELKNYNNKVTSILVYDIFQMIVKNVMVLDGLLIRTLSNGNSVAIIKTRVHSKYCDRDYYLPLSILYPISGSDEDKVRVFLIVSKNNTINRACQYVSNTNEIMIDKIELWSYSQGLLPVINALRSMFSCVCPLFEINQEDTLIPFEELIIGKKLGEGASAAVYQGQYRSRPVAIKKMLKIPKESEYRYLLREFQTQMRFHHSCILEIIGHSEDPSGFPLLVMELGGPSLEDVVLKEKTKLSNEKKKKYLLNIARALEYLHSYNVIHRDIKMANVLLTDDTAKIADFGYAREIENNVSIEVSFCGSPAIMAPELIDNAKCSTKVDVYSYGCVVYEMIVEQPCYFDKKFKKRMQFYQEVVNGMRPTLFPGLPREPVEVMQLCWLEDKKRPCMKDIVKMVEAWKPELWTTDVLFIVCSIKTSPITKVFNHSFPFRGDIINLFPLLLSHLNKRGS